MRTSYFSILIWFIFLAGPGKGQQVQVLDKSDLQPISQVSITNSAGTLLVVTDLRGQADISAFVPGDSLHFTHVAYQPLVILKSRVPANNQVFMTENIIRLDELVVSANRMEEKKSELPYKIETIQAKEIQFENPQTTASMLEQTGDVFVQQSQMGGGSPVLRGMEANRVLLVLDGVRMNNAIYRSGHIQSIITVDPSLLASMEILYGPGSVIYGSDALGGVISMQTFDPLLSRNGKVLIQGQVYGRYSSANTEKTGGFHLNVGLKKWAFLTAFTYSDFDNLREGRTRNPFYGTFGERPFYAERINGKDSLVTNPKPWIQIPSGYSQYSLMQKALFAPSDKVRLSLNFQYSNSSNIPRYDRLTDTINGALKYAEWYYGPQTRLFAALQAALTNKNLFYDNANFILAYQNIREARASRRFGKKWLNVNDESLNVFSLYGDLSKKLAAKDELRYGIAVDFNNVGSSAFEQDINTGIELKDIATRYPDQKAQMLTAAAYLSNVWKINRALAFSQGIRYSYIYLDAAWSEPMMQIMKFPFASEVTQTNNAINGYLGFVVTPPYQWKFSLIASSGYRAPNIDDIGKVNDSNSKDRELIVPNPALKPETAYNLEVSVGKTIENAVRLELTGYYTWLTDAIVKRPFTYNGKDSIFFDSVLCQVLANTNAGQAYIYGVQCNLLAQVTRIFSITSNLTYTVGWVKSDDVPLDHIPPVFGMTSFQLEMKRFKGDFYIMYNAWKRIQDYSPYGEDNQAYATPEGMPA
ncbi:MAG: TonB-dependent receptor, partial [bacterium]